MSYDVKIRKSDQHIKRMERMKIRNLYILMKEKDHIPRGSAQRKDLYDEGGKLIDVKIRERKDEWKEIEELMGVKKGKRLNFQGYLQSKRVNRRKMRNI